MTFLISRYIQLLCIKPIDEQAGVGFFNIRKRVCLRLPFEEYTVESGLQNRRIMTGKLFMKYKSFLLGTNLEGDELRGISTTR